jgi:TIR domain
MSSAVNVFISYSHEDKAWLTRVQQHLKPVVRGERVVCWADTELRAGDQWHPAIDAALHEAQAAILLLSPGFYASDFIAEQELPKLLSKAASGSARLLIVVLRPCWFALDAQLNGFQTVHDPKKPLSTLSEAEQDAVLLRLATEVKNLLPGPDRGATAATPAPRATALKYDPYHAVLPPLFVGREAELGELARCLDRCQSVSLVADWRMGKSSLLATWAQQARSRGRVVVQLNGQAAEGASVAALVAGITGRACAAADGDAAATQLDAWVQAQSGGGLAPLVLLDEADGLLKQDRRFWARVRGMLDRCCWVLATRSEIVEQAPDSPLANQLHLLRLGLLEETAAAALVALGNVGVAGEDLMRVWAGRHPFYLQLLGYFLQLHPGDEAAALDRFQDAAQVRLREWWGLLPERDRVALKNWTLGDAAKRPGLRRRGFVDANNQPFGQVLVNWLEDFE